MRFRKASNIRWPLLWGRTLGKSLPGQQGGLSGALCFDSGRAFFHLSTDSPASDLAGGRAAYRQPWEGWKTARSQDGDLLLGWGINLQLCACIFETLLYKALREAFHQYMTMVLSLAAFLAVIRLHRVSVWNVIHSFIIRVSVAFSEQLTFRPLNGNYSRMGHVWGKVWIMTAVPEKAERRISDWKLILVTLHMLTPVTLLCISPLTEWFAHVAGSAW